MKEIDGKLVTATEELTRLWGAGQYRKALKLAASWPKLGDHEDAIRAGWAAASNPNFYRQLDKDPAADYAAGLAAVAARYNLPPATETTLAE